MLRSSGVGSKCSRNSSIFSSSNISVVPMRSTYASDRSPTSSGDTACVANKSDRTAS
jgi:hypothetical protein